MATGAQAQTDLPFEVESITSFDEPWALAFLPDGRMLVTEQKGSLFIVTQNGEKSPDVDGVPDVAYGGQGGLGDVALHPDFIENNVIYLSYAESGVGGHSRGAAVVRAVLNQTEDGGKLSDVEVIWRQYPKVVGFGHYGHRLLFDDEGYLWISSGDRQKFTPAQDMQTNLGKILRLHDDGSVPDDNPFVDYFDANPLVDDEGVYGQIWSLGHRNVLGLAIDLEGQLWDIEMGPRGGDELNLVNRAANHGYPIVSDGDHYDGREIPDHDTHPEFEKPAVAWTPVISPGDLIIYRGDLFSDWRGDAFAAGLSSQAIVRVELDGVDAARSNATIWVREFAASSRDQTAPSGSWRTTTKKVLGACSNSHQRAETRDNSWPSRHWKPSADIGKHCATTEDQCAEYGHAGQFTGTSRFSSSCQFRTTTSGVGSRGRAFPWTKRKR